MRETLRIDKWLWHARFYKTRTLAARAVTDGKVRINSGLNRKPATTVGVGDTLTIRLSAQDIRIVRLLGLGSRRGPAPEAQALYDVISPASPEPGSAPMPTQRTL